MAFSGNISYGMQGDNVKRIQEALNKTGKYNLTVDGIWGDKTDAAVRDYQKSNNLTVDGIVGENTWASLFGGGSGSTQNPGYTYTPFEYDDFSESKETSDAKNSLTNANKALTDLGDFSWIDQGKLDDYTSQYENREKFSYDFNADALYQQYKDKYIKQAKMASADVMGQAAAMTGGYGSSYAQTVGNQAYQSNLEKLNDVIPELYQLAYDKYNQEGQDLLNTISLLRGERDFAYGQYNDQYTKLANDRDYWSNMYNNLYNRDYTQYSNDRSFEQINHNTAEGYKYNEYRDSVADQQWQAEFDEAKRQYEDSKASVGSSGGSGGSKGTTGEVKPTETANANRFIALHQTKDEYMRRGKSYSEFLAYIDGEIEKNQDNYSDEELMYLKQYYGL